MRDRIEMAELCAVCPLVTACADYAIKDRPIGGWWPGINIPTAVPRKEQAA